MTDPAKSPARIAGMFDAIAPRYDLLNHLLSGNIDRRWRRIAVESLHLTGRETVLDVCTGTADLALTARRARPAANRVVGVDFADAMLRLGLAKVRRSADRGVALVRGDAIRLPVRDECVDAVTIGFGIRNVEEPERACRDLYRVLRRGGRLAILEFSVPTGAVMRRAYLAYFNHVLPRIGRLISRHSGAYAYLPASVGAFATPAEFAEMLRSIGFSEVTARPLTFGVAILYAAVKPAGAHSGFGLRTPGLQPES